MVRDILVGLVIDSGDSCDHFKLDQYSIWREFYQKLVPELVLKIMLHHKFHYSGTIDGSKTPMKNNIYWNYVITKKYGQNGISNCTNFSEFNQATYDKFVINFKKMVLNDGLKTEKRNDLPLLKLVIDLIMARFDWNTTTLVSPVVPSKIRYDSEKLPTVPQHHYVYFISMFVDQDIMKNLINYNNSSMVYSYIKRQKFKFSWLSLMIFSNNDKHTADAFMKYLKKLKIQFYSLFKHLVSNDSLNWIYLLLSHIEKEHALRHSEGSFKDSNQSNVQVMNSGNNKNVNNYLNVYSQSYLSAFLYKDVFNWNVPIDCVPHYSKFKKLSSLTVHDIIPKTKENTIEESECVKINPDSLQHVDNTDSSTATEFSATITNKKCQNDIENIDKSEYNILMSTELEKCKKQFNQAKQIFSEQQGATIHNHNSEDLKIYLEKKLLISIKDFNEQIADQHKTTLLKNFCHQILYRLYILQEYSQSLYLIREVTGLLRKLALIISPDQMTNFLNNHILVQFEKTLKNSLSSIYDDLMIAKPKILKENPCLETSSPSNSPFGSNASTPLPKYKHDSHHSQLHGSTCETDVNHDFSQTYIDKSLKKTFQPRKNIIINDLSRHRRMIPIKDKPFMVRRLLFNTNNELCDDNSLAKKINAPITDQITFDSGLHNQNHDSNVESFLTDLDHTQDHFMVIPSKNIQKNTDKSRPKSFYSSKSFTQTQSFTFFQNSNTQPHCKVQTLIFSKFDDNSHTQSSSLKFDSIFATPTKITITPSTKITNAGIIPQPQHSAVSSPVNQSAATSTNNSSLVAISPNNSWVENSAHSLIGIDDNKSNIYSPSLKKYYTLPCNNNNNENQLPLPNFSPYKNSQNTIIGFSTPNKFIPTAYSHLIRSPFNKSPLQLTKKFNHILSPSPRKLITYPTTILKPHENDISSKENKSFNDMDMQNKTSSNKCGIEKESSN